MEQGQFFLQCECVQSELNVSDKYTRESPGLEASLTTHAFRKIWDYFGPFQWDLMATFANLQTWKGSLYLSIQGIMIKWLKVLTYSSNNFTCVRKCFVSSPSYDIKTTQVFTRPESFLCGGAS